MAEGPPPAAAEAQGTSVQPSATPAEVTQPSATATWVLITLAKPGMAPMAYGKGTAADTAADSGADAGTLDSSTRPHFGRPACAAGAGRECAAVFAAAHDEGATTFAAGIGAGQEGAAKAPATGGEAMDDGATRQVSQWRCAQDEGATNMVGGTGTRGTPSRFG